MDKPKTLKKLVPLPKSPSGLKPLKPLPKPTLKSPSKLKPLKPLSPKPTLKLKPLKPLSPKSTLKPLKPLSPKSTLKPLKPLSHSLTGIKDVDFKILEELDDYELAAFCEVNKDAQKLCSDEVFWRNRLIKRFGTVQKPANRTYKDFYMALTRELNKEIDMDNLKIKDKDIYQLIRELNGFGLPLEKNRKTYLIHDNGGRPFKVRINKDSVLVYMNYGSDSDYEDFEDDESFFFSIFVFLNPIKVFIGKSPENEMTILSGGYGKEFDGNTILINTDRNNYVYIGSRIYSFQAKYEIVDYISPVENNDVPYPYAIDKNKNIYLMQEEIILHNGKINKLNHSHSSLDLIQDPYRYYYDNQETQYLLGFKDYYVDNELDEDRKPNRYSMYFIADIDRFLKKHPNIYIIENGKKRYIKDEELRNAMKKHAENIGVELFKTNLLRKRRF